MKHTNYSVYEMKPVLAVTKEAVTCFSVSDMRRLGLPVSTPVKYLDDVSIPGAATASNK